MASQHVLSSREEIRQGATEKAAAVVREGETALTPLHSSMGIPNSFLPGHALSLDLETLLSCPNLGR